MAKIEQNCGKCGKRLSFDSSDAVDTEVTCPDKHRHVVARCPVTACPAKRIAVPAGAKVGKRVDHSGQCEAALVVTARDPTTLART